MSCEFVTQLSKLRKLSAESVENTKKFDPFKEYLHVERQVEKELRELLRDINDRQGKCLVLLCGSAEMTENHFPVLMITASAIDTITSGTGDLSTTGMPFNSAAIIEKIKSDINDAQLPLSDQILLKMELVRKQTDRFSDKSSLYEYAELLTVLGRGYVKEEDYSSFSLLYDPAVQPLQDPKKIKDRLDSNHQ